MLRLFCLLSQNKNSNTQMQRNLRAIFNNLTFFFQLLRLIFYKIKTEIGGVWTPQNGAPPNDGVVDFFLVLHQTLGYNVAQVSNCWELIPFSSLSVQECVVLSLNPHFNRNVPFSMFYSCFDTIQVQLVSQNCDFFVRTGQKFTKNYEIQIMCLTLRIVTFS